MLNTNKYAIIISFFSLWISVHFSFMYQQIFGFVVIFLFGILHGANDLALYQKINEKKNYNSLKKIVLYYVGIVILGAFLFYFLPLLALFIFILSSSFHFGQQHWNAFEIKRTNWFVVFETIYGLFILFLLFSFHEKEVEEIVRQISNVSVEMIHFTSVTTVVGILLVVMGIVVHSQSGRFKSEIIVNLFYLMVFAVIFKIADLIWAFAIYFVVWHSIPSIKEQMNFLYGDVTLKNFKLYFKSAFLYWFVSLLGILILYFIFREQKIFDALFFSFLAAVTFPHTIVIIKMKNRQ
jgi:beta-carotene 15,15'-dioxygenase